jgi:uncharacterized protein
MRAALLVLVLLVLGPQAEAQMLTEEPVAVGRGGAALHGTITWPVGSGTVPGVLIIAGSGPVDRDGNTPTLRNDSLLRLGRGLAELGIAALRTDKRGIGESRGAMLRESDLRLDTYVQDTLAWSDLLRRQRRIGPLFLLGHSEGALIATLAAQREMLAGLILLAGAGEPGSIVIMRQLAAQGVSPELRQSAYDIIAALTGRRPAPDVPAPLAPLFRPSVQPYLASWLSVDPAGELARTRTPVLIVQGDADLQITPLDAGRLAAARSGTDLRIIPHMNHVLRQVTLDRLANLVTYGDPTLPLAPDLLPTLAHFIDAAR